MFQRVLFILVTLLSVLSCGKNNKNPVPNLPVDVTIDLGFPSYSALQGVSGYTYVNGGSRGIIVYRKSLNEFVAFDRHSPADIEGTCVEPLYPDANNFLELIDSCNNARFSLYDGSHISNSEYGLRQYATQYNGSNILRIFN